MKRRSFLGGLGATALWANSPAWALDKSQHIPTDQEILAGTTKRIEKIRSAERVITVHDGKGKRIRGANIKIEQLSHDFLFGSNFFMFGNVGDPALEEAYRNRFSAVLNYCTLGFYWGAYESERGKPNYGYTDKVVDYCRAHHITCKGHPLVWDYPDLVPRWAPKDLKELERLSKARVHDVVDYYKGRIDIWDVVNEATHLVTTKQKSLMTDMGRAMGQRAYVAEHLQVARAANPEATLLVNDYHNDQPFYKLLDSLRKNKKLLFDVVGIQSHQHQKPWSMDKVWNVCERFARLGVPIHFTETTFVSGKGKTNGPWTPTNAKDEAKQAEQTVHFYRTLFSHPSVQAITWWDFSDRSAWQGAPAGWLRADMSPKPVYEQMMALIKGDWWTKTSGHTDWLGKFHTKAFYGKYRVIAQLPSGAEVTQEVHWNRAAPKVLDIVAG